jgi:hypothetical protein
MSEVTWDQARALWTSGRTEPSTWIPTEAPPASSRLGAVREAFAGLRRRAEQCEETDPWLVEAASTAVPEAVEAMYQCQRRGEAPTLRQAFLRYLDECLEEQI